MANLYDLKRFDLNLLVIFECIYQHLSISKAAEMLFITPSAVSQSLQRLRTQLNDPLFVRAGKGITPTTIAVNLHQHLSKNLNQIEQTINMMANADLDKKFIIYGPQLFSTPELSSFINALLAEPDLHIEYHDYTSINDSVENLLHYRKADIVITTSQVQNRALACEKFYDTETVLVCREDHPRLGTHATIEEILQERFTYYDVDDSWVKKYQYDNEIFLAERNCVFRSSSFVSTINAIYQTDLIGIVPRPYYTMLKASLRLKEITLPAPLPRMSVYVCYNRASLNSELFTRVIKSMKI
ncbi:DNA-binding transcriptional repressor CitR [Kluyvera genomosp. 3]|uniref:LysR family transcriptional regulator n=1 Tax=Kluyvera genomosp. 3 TaxID=2774055 RepID=A0A6G9RN86_9ENTR|nr:LysR family transcriptional regulator [Kluyvera genomosp. 3]QIR28424.1 LysR family transcriptional regulator [Kluyvera genomosp. 3]